MTGGTEFPFELPDGYRDPRGRVHRTGCMRLATAGDEARALSDFRVHLRPEAFLSVILPRVVVRLGDLERLDAGIVDRLSEADLVELGRLYAELNGYTGSGAANDAR